MGAPYIIFPGNVGESETLSDIVKNCKMHWGNERRGKLSKSIAIIETSAVSSAELKALCREMMPEVTVYEIIDSSLIEEVKANGGPTKAVRSRMFKYYEIAAGLGVDAILNQCSSVSEVAEEAKKLIDVPIVKVDEAMARKAVSMGEKIAVVATVASTLPPSCRLWLSLWRRRRAKRLDLREYLVGRRNGPSDRYGRCGEAQRYGDRNH